MSRTRPLFSLARRAAGVLLHPTSLPGPHGSGDFGPAALAFVDFLTLAGQTWWQTLPLGPIGAANSPYSSTSAFAYSPWLVSIDTLVRDGLLERRDAPPLPGRRRPERVHFPTIARYRAARLRRAAGNVSRWLAGDLKADYERFCGENRHWLDDFALYEALRAAQGGRAWTKWERGLRLRLPAALEGARRRLRDELEFHQIVQFLADRQWRALRRHARARGVALMGDIPIFVSHESADVWSHPQLFRLTRAGSPTVVSGCPPDSFSAAGQLWGHPHYRWEAHARDGFAWWIERFRATFERFDAARLDHFLGFHRAWAVPARAPTAAHGTYVDTPGREIFAAAQQALGRLEIVAEDLGAVTPEAAALRDELGLPGMRILQNGFRDGARFDQPHSYPRNCVAYTGTHDNATLVGWFERASRRHAAARGARRAPGRSAASAAQRATYVGRDGLTERERALRYLNGTPRTIHWDAIRALYQSPATLVITPMQDVLGLDNSARMNTPATVRENWQWRLAPGAASAALAMRMRTLAETYERLPPTRRAEAPA